jgi:hypothetical protein
VIDGADGEIHGDLTCRDADAMNAGRSNLGNDLKGQEFDEGSVDRVDQIRGCAVMVVCIEPTTFRLSARLSRGL